MLVWRRKLSAILQWRGPDNSILKLPPAEAAEKVASVGPVIIIDGNSAAQYVHEQSSPSATWIVNHNLGRRPAAVSVLSPGGIEVDAGVLHNSDNQLTISFGQPYVGSAILL